MRFRKFYKYTGKRVMASVLAGALLMGSLGLCHLPAEAAESALSETETGADMDGDTDRESGGETGEVQESADRPSWEASIPDMLAAGEYEEGVVIVGYDYSVEAPAERAAETAAEETEQILEVDEEYVIPEDTSAAQGEDAQDASAAQEEDAQDTHAAQGEDAQDASAAQEEAAQEEAVQGSSADTGEEPGKVSIEILQDDSRTTAELLYELAGDPRVVFAEPNYIMENTTVDWEPCRIEDAGDLTGVADQSEIADLTGLQWACTDEVAFTLKDQAGVASAQVPNFGATGSNMEGDPILVAVIDTPIDYTNEDLADRLYHFSKEEQELLGCDAWGYNACWQFPDGRMDYWSGADHGVHCAGIIGAAWDGHGTSGVGSNVKIVSIENNLKDGRTSLINNLRAFAFVKKANENGIPIRITSNSYGLLQHSTAMDAAVRQVGEEYGVISIFAAGNSNKDVGVVTDMADSLEDNPYAIVVAATDEREKKASFSSYGSSVVDLGAPGVAVLSTVMRAESTYIADAVPSANLRYEGFEGEAAPDVTIRRVNLQGSEYVPVVDGEAVQADADAPHFMGSFGGELPFTSESSIRYAEMRFGDLSSEEGPLYLGFSFYVPDTTTSVSAVVKTDNGDDIMLEPADMINCLGGAWAVYSAEIPMEANLSDLTVIAGFFSGNAADTMYLDSVGVGTKRVPYRHLSGTSMATPMVAGAAAVLAAKHRDFSGLELASAVKASVRPAASMKGITRSGGVLDLGGAAQNTAPVITEVSYAKGVITVSGSNFGDSIGRIRIVKRSVGQNALTVYDSSKDKEQTGIVWEENRISLPYEDTEGGVIQLMVENLKGKNGSRTLMLSPSAAVYEKELPYDFSLGNLGRMDSSGDYDTAGALVGLGDHLYYLPTMTMVEENPCVKAMHVYDIAAGTWSEGPELPEALAHVSAAVAGGKLYVLGESVNLAHGRVGYYDDHSEVRVYCFEPASSRWSRCVTDGLTTGGSLVNCDGQLSVVGAGGSAVVAYEPESGAGRMLVRMDKDHKYPSVAAQNGAIYIYDAENYNFAVIRNGEYEDRSDALPTVVTHQNGRPEENSWTRQGTLVPVTAGILLVGPSEKSTSADQMLSDTFLLKKGSSKFEAYPKRMSDAKVKASAAASYRGWLYAMGSATFEQGERFFRATELSVDEYPGDVLRREDTAVWKHDKKGWWLRFGDGTWAKNEWFRWKGTWYYFGEDGYMVTKEWREGWWLGASGALKYNGRGRWRHNKTGWWYEDSKGWYAKAQWQRIDGNWYYFKKNGYMKTGWLKAGTTWYYFGEDGICVNP